MVLNFFGQLEIQILTLQISIFGVICKIWFPMKKLPEDFLLNVQERVNAIRHKGSTLFPVRCFNVNGSY